MKKIFNTNNLLLNGAKETNMKNIVYILGMPILMMIIGSFITVPFLTFMSYDPIQNSGVQIAAQLILGCTPIVLVYFYWIKFIEKRNISSIGITFNKSSMKNYLKGFGVGLLLMAITTVSIVLFCGGSISITGKFDFNFLIIFLFVIIGWVIQGAEEEIMIRGHMLPMLGKKMPIVVSVIISSSYFSVLHLGNPNVGTLAIINLFLFGFSAAIYALLEENLMGVCAIHSAWNFAQGNIFGFPVSGQELNSFSIFTVNTQGNMLDGAAFGPEGGLIETIVLLSFILILMVKYFNKNNVKVAN